MPWTPKDNNFFYYVIAPLCIVCLMIVESEPVLVVLAVVFVLAPLARFIWKSVPRANDEGN